MLKYPFHEVSYVCLGIEIPLTYLNSIYKSMSVTRNSITIPKIYANAVLRCDFEILNFKFNCEILCG